MERRYSNVPAHAAGAKLSRSALQVLIAIGACADGDGNAFPGYTFLAEQTGITRRNIRRAVDELVRAGILNCEARRRTENTRAATSNLYRICYEAVSSPVMTPPVISSDDTLSSAAMTPPVISGDDTPCHQR